jgi:hypothetical protein
MTSFSKKGQPRKFGRTAAIGAVAALALLALPFGATAATAAQATPKTAAKQVAAEQTNVAIAAIKGYVCDPARLPATVKDKAGLVVVKAAAVECPRTPTVGNAVYTAQVVDAKTAKVLQTIKEKIAVGKKAIAAAQPTPAPQPSATTPPAPTATPTPQPTTPPVVTPEPTVAPAPTTTVLKYNCQVGQTIAVTATNLTGTIKYSKSGLNLTARGDGSKPSNSIIWTIQNSDRSVIGQDVFVTVEGTYTSLNPNAITGKQVGCFVGVVS